MSKVLVFGGAGFIGHNVTNILESMNVETLVFDNFSDFGSCSKAQLRNLYKRRIEKYQATTVTGDICNVNQVAGVMGLFSPDIIIHLASYPRQKVVAERPIDASDVMMTGLITVLEAAIKYKVKRFVYASSSMVYGDFVSDCQTEDSPTNPIGQYGIMKLAGEWLVKDYARKFGLEYTIIRPSAVYGELDVTDRVIGKYMEAAMHGKELHVKGENEVLDFTHVSDTATGFALAALSNNARNQTYNITRSDPRSFTLLDVANMVVLSAGKGTIVCSDKDTSFPTRGRLSIKKAMQELSYSPTVNIDAGIATYYQNFIKERHEN
jgi:UDP-glucose 4-epimerase